MKETKGRRQTWKGSDSQLQTPVGPWAWARRSLCQPCWLGPEPGAKHWGAPTCQHNLCIGEDRGRKAEPGLGSSERRAGETDGGAGGSSPGKQTEQGCLRGCWGQRQGGVFPVLPKKKTTLSALSLVQSCCLSFLWLSFQTPQRPRALAEQPGH